MRSFLERLKRSSRGCRLRPSIGLDLFEEGYCADFFGYLIPLPFLDRWHREPEEIVDRWGFYIHDKTIVFDWGDKLHKRWRFPWDLEHLKCEVMRPDGTWAKEVNSWEDGEPDGRWEGKFPYRYVLRNGTVQEVTATVHVERREWRWRCAMWCPWTALVRQSIDIQFSGEVGERSGSWKGGCIGCGYEMLPGETAEQCLRRMEKERVFD